MSFNNLDLNLLRVFDAIFQTRSVTVAASNLHLTQPAVSKQLTACANCSRILCSSAPTTEWRRRLARKPLPSRFVRH